MEGEPGQAAGGGGSVGPPARQDGVAQTAGAGRRCCFCLDVCGERRTGSAASLRNGETTEGNVTAARERAGGADGAGGSNSGGRVRRASSVRGLGSVSAEQLIQNLLDIELNSKLKAALAEWDRLEKYQKSKIDDKEKEKSDVVTQVFNIIGFFSVFQGVVFSAVSQLAAQTQPLCGKVWVPSVLSGIATIVTIIALLLKFLTLEELEKQLIRERAFFQRYSKLVKILPLKGKDFDFQNDAENIISSEDSNSWLSFWWKKISVLAALIVSTGVFVLSYAVILCDKFVVRRWN